MLRSIATHTSKPIKHIDLYGGELGILPDEYLTELIDISKSNAETVNIVTNLSILKSHFMDLGVDLSVSYDFDVREKNVEVLTNMLMLDRPVSILILASPQMIARDVPTDIEFLNNISNIRSVEIKPYSTNQSNEFTVTNRDFERYVSEWIACKGKTFEFINEQKIINSLEKTYRSFSDDHVYITPGGKYGVLEFDAEDREFFQEYSDFTEYLSWARGEIVRVGNNIHCSQCKHFGHCLSEHIRPVHNLTQSCNGYYYLLEWYDGQYRS